MKPRHFASVAKVFLPLLCLIGLCLITPSDVAGEGILPAAFPSYAAEPPFAAAGIKSNLLLMLDNSASMYDLAYSNPATYCVDDSYQNGKTYSGYFEPTVMYQYGANRFVVAASPLPSCSSGTGSCAASTSYLYLEMADPVAPATRRTVTSFMASGNFLNWLSASRLDVQKKVLTGGKFILDAGSTTRGVLQAESRGCQGKRFVKMLPGINVTFVVRGPMYPEVGFIYDTSRGGETTIEIYDKPYRKTECLGAIDAWLTGNSRDVFTSKVNECIDAKDETGVHTTTMPSEGKIFSYAVRVCYEKLVNSGASTVSSLGVFELCDQRYQGLYGIKYTAVDINSVDGVCSRNIRHLAGAGGLTGFIGRCVGSSSGGLTVCASDQMTDYCNEIRNQSLADPSYTAEMDGGRTHIASYILDGGVYNLGSPSGTFHARVALDLQPLGLLQKFAGSINFGAMQFNPKGAAGAECGPGKLPCARYCKLAPRRDCFADSDCPMASAGSCAEGVDGGRVISYINDAASPLGDHASGLVGAIDRMEGSSWTPYAEAFYNAIGYYAQRADLRLGTADFNLSKPAPSQYLCQRNNILMVSDGISTADSNPAVESLATLYAAGREAVTGREGNLPPLEGSRSLDDLAWIAAHRNIKSFSKTVASTATPASPQQSITTHVIFTGVSGGASGEADPATLMRRTAESGGGVFATASDPSALYDQMLMVLRQVASGANAGGDVSIQTGGGNGALFLQQRYFPAKGFDGDTSASWIGEMQGLWYYIDPFIANSSGGGSTLREDTVRDRMLRLSDDRAVAFGDGTASAFYDRNGDGNSDGARENISPDAVQALWRAGRQLWSRNLDTEPRKIFTPLLPQGNAVGHSNLMRFSFVNPDHSAILQPYLQAATTADAVKLIRYVHGFDFPGDPAMRSRTVRLGDIPASAVSSKTDDPYVTNPRDKGIGVWKLGDVISSAAKVQSGSALSSYDLPAPRGYGDQSYRSYLGSEEYRSRGMIYLGANDGMLHAFRMGTLKPGTGTVTAVLDPGSTTPGEEAWAFIPRNVLPYLTFLKEPAYQHLYLVDGAVTLADVSIGDTGSGSCSADSYWSCVKEASVTMPDPLDPNKEILDPTKNTWRTILVGSMGLGGASSASCMGASDPAGTGAPCVPTPIPDPAADSKRIGYSSYFALDVTDPANPSLLWEISPPNLGYSTSGAAIVRVGDPGLNGRWFAVFGSGPTGPVRDQQFLGQSNQNLRFFVVDLRSGKLVSTIDTGIENAFAGSISGGVIDDRSDGVVLVSGANEERRQRYQDDAIYVGYTAMDPETKSWTRGGVGRIMIGELPDLAQPTDSNVGGDFWKWSRVIGFPSDNTGPVTTSVVRLQETRPNNNNLWLYFGTGRYYYRSFEQDDFSGQRAIYGVKEPCYKSGRKAHLDKSCTDAVRDVVCGAVASTFCLTDQTARVSEVAQGWRIDLGAPDAKVSAGAERVVADPVSLTGGAVFFPTFQPSSSPCSLGSSFLWGVRYDTGGAIPAGWLQGKVLTQLSTGELRETLPGDLNDKGNRRSAAMPGSKAASIKIVTNSGLKPLKKIIHIQER